MIFYSFVDLKAASKYARSPSKPANPSPVGTPQRRATETHQSQVCISGLFFLLFCFVLSCLSLYLKCQFLIGPENLFLSLVWNSLDCLKIFCSSWSNWCGDSKSNSFVSTI